MINLGAVLSTISRAIEHRSADPSMVIPFAANEKSSGDIPFGAYSAKKTNPAMKCQTYRARLPKNVAATIHMTASVRQLFLNEDWILPEMNPARPIEAKAMKYSITICTGVAIQASPKAICNRPHTNPANMPAFHPLRYDNRKIGTIAIEMEILGDSLIDGSISRITANAAINEASSKTTRRMFFIKKSPLLDETKP